MASDSDNRPLGRCCGGGFVRGSDFPAKPACFGVHVALKPSVAVEHHSKSCGMPSS